MTAPSPGGSGVKYHAKTLATLGDEAPRERRPAHALIAWASEHGVELPAAYLEWAELDPGFRLLQKYSNDDHFFGDPSALVTTPALRTAPTDARGLTFEIENQGNYEKIVMLDRGDDPPVLFSWCHAPWSEHAQRFSDCVQGQIFDWLYERVKENEAVATAPRRITLANHHGLAVTRERALAVLRHRFAEGPTTYYAIEGNTIECYRFFASRDARMRLMVTSDPRYQTHLDLAAPRCKIAALEAEMLDALAVYAVPDRWQHKHHHLAQALTRLEGTIDEGYLPQLRHTALERPTEEAIARLIACHAARAIRDRSADLEFPRERETFQLGGAAWGIALHYRRKEGGWWLEAIVPA